MRKTLLLSFVAVALLFSGCAKNSTEEEDPGEVTFVCEPGQLDFQTSGGSLSLSVLASADWYMNDLPSWLESSEYSGSKGSADVEFTATVNTESEKRNAVIEFVCGKEHFELAVSQSAATNLTLSQTSFELSSKAATLHLTITSIGNWYMSGVPSWITVPSAEGAGGTTSVELQVAASEADDVRTASISVQSRGESQTVSISQAQLDKLILSNKTITTADTVATVSVTVASNVDYSVSLSDTWVKRVESRAMNTTKLFFECSANTTGSDRTALVVFDGTDLKDTLSITQTSRENRPNLFGYVRDMDGNPVQGVVVSDGRLTTLTDDNGMYALASQKQMGYVMISIPSGYEASFDPTAPAFPTIHKMLGSGALQTEQVDFNIRRLAGGNDRYAVVFWTDSHFINRQRTTETTTDLVRFNTSYLPDMKAEVAKLGNIPTYSIHLGDVTWDAYWYNNTTTMDSRVCDILAYYNFNRDFPYTLFHTMGNHDNNPRETGDVAGQTQFTQRLCPTFYSFNLGKVHYMVLDDCIFSAYSSYSYSLTGTTVPQVCQWEWIRNDLKYVPRGTKVMLCVHAGLLSLDNSFVGGIGSMAGANTLLKNYLKDYNVEIMTGHTHLAVHSCYNNSIREHRVTSTCPVGWRNDHRKGNTYCDYDMESDGAAVGYFIMTFDGDNQDYYYKGFCIDRSRQMRLYDMSSFDQKYLDELGYTSDMVVANVWQWEDGWTISATENDQPINITRFYGKDPVFLRWSTETGSGYTPSLSNHFFKITGCKGLSTVKVTVKDRFGRTYTESVTRSK